MSSSSEKSGNLKKLVQKTKAKKVNPVVVIQAVRKSTPASHAYDRTFFADARKGRKK